MFFVYIAPIYAHNFLCNVLNISTPIVSSTLMTQIHSRINVRLTSHCQESEITKSQDRLYMVDVYSNYVTAAIIAESRCLFAKLSTDTPQYHVDYDMSSH